MTDEQIQELRSKAEAATRGPWEAGECGGWLVMAGPLITNRPGYIKGGRGHVATVNDDDLDEDSQAANAEFIAAANPATVIALLDALRAARVEGFARAREQAENVLRGRANLWRSDSGPYKVLRDAAELVRAMQDGAGDCPSCEHESHGGMVCGDGLACLCVRSS